MTAQPDVTQNARRFKVEIDTANSDAAPVWVLIRGLNECTPSPQAPTFEEDDGYEDEGWGSETKTSLSWSIEMKLLRKRNPSTNAFDPGQEALRSRSELFGASGMAHVRWYDRFGGTEAYEGWAEVEWVPDGGGTKDVDKITVTLHGKGKRDTITNPAV